MSDMPVSTNPAVRGAAWKWWVCGLLLLATMINYMDRLTLNQTSKRVMEEVGFDEEGYGELESAFAYAFALGAILSGWMADRWNVRWLYPTALFAWSAAGFATGLVEGFYGLLACRFLLGLAEAGHWPCALRTTQRILPPAERSMGNSLLQSGAAVGALLTPLLILALPKGPGTWRYPFLIVGATGMTWVLLWLASVRASDLKPAHTSTSPAPAGLLLVLIGLLGGKTTASSLEVPSSIRLAVSLAVSGVGIVAVTIWLLQSSRDELEQGRGTFLRCYGVLLLLVLMINGTWHFFRAWLPLFLQNQHDYSEEFMQWFLLAYYVSTDLGSLAAGFAALRLAQRRLSIHGSRLAVFTICAILCAISGAAAAFVPAGPLLLGVLLVVGFASLGLFPNYYSLTQELTTRHQGKLSGALGCCNWLGMSVMHETVGVLVKNSGSYSLGMAVAAFFPIVGVAVLLLFWNRKPE
jgi:ACS family hexuronate transporter-like MFS transporter